MDMLTSLGQPTIRLALVKGKKFTEINKRKNKVEEIQLANLASLEPSQAKNSMAVMYEPILTRHSVDYSLD